MPTKPIDYSNTIIYKLCCNDPSITDIYVGHTTNFTKRKNLHKSTCTNEATKAYNFYVYQFIRSNGGWNNWDMIEICRQSCIDGNDARKIERKYFEELGATLNSEVPSRTKKEYREEHIEEVKENLKQYYEEHKEEIKETRKLYNELHKEELKETQKLYNELHKEEIKEKKRHWYEEHKDEIKEKNRQYRELHKEEIKEKKRQYRELHKEEIKEKKRQDYQQKKLKENV